MHGYNCRLEAHLWLTPSGRDFYNKYAYIFMTSLKLVAIKTFVYVYK